MSMLSNLKLPSGVSGLTGGKLMQKRSWLVIISDDAPVGEVNNANALTPSLRRKLNIVPFNAWTDSKATSRSRLNKYTNLLIVGGPIASKLAYDLNDSLEPKFYFTKVRDQGADETWRDYLNSGGLKVVGFVANGVKIAGAAHLGALCSGTQKMGVRTSQIIVLGGWTYEDTCVLVKAFTEGAAAGIYNCYWTAAIPNQDVNPDGMSYTLRP